MYKNTPTDLKRSPKIPASVIAAAVFTLGLAFSGAASAAYVHDGIIVNGVDEYDNSFTTEWYNDHETLQFPEGGGQTTTVWWTNTVSETRIGLEAPLEVKNMIWGDYLSDATFPSEAYDEAILYYQSWCSPNDGNPAALNGSNCAHHDDGFDPAHTADVAHPEKTFLANIASADFKTMVDSEKVEIMGKDFKLIDSENGAYSKEGASVITSLTYILDDANDALFPNCDSSSCDAVGTSMSYEMLFADAAIGQSFIDWLIDSDNDLLFHMSPERGGIAVIPVPAAFWLFGTALIGFIGISRRTNLG